MKTMIREAEMTAIDKMIEEFVAEQNFTGSVLVSKGDRLLLKKGYGFANLEWNIPNDSTTKFSIASVTKQFTAAAILLLEERDELSTDDLVKKHLPEAPDSWNQITILHLITHTAGLHSYTDSDLLDFFKPLKKLVCTPENLMGLFANLPLEFEPGEKVAYSNSGYVVLGRIIEKISGQSYADFLQENIFKPLGMKDSGYLSHAEILPKRASGYYEQDGKMVNTDYIDEAVLYSAGSLYSTVEDLLKWQRGLFSGKLLRESTAA